MKMNMIIRKKHIVLSALVVALGIAVYLNWDYVNTQQDYQNSDLLTVGAFADGTEGSSQSGESAETAAYGEAYFAEAKLSRTKSRDEAADMLKYMLEDANLTTDQRAELTLAATELAESIETEGKIENLIKAKGFSECMVYLEEDKVDVIVRCETMTDSEAAQIKDAILGEVEIPNENISIIEIN